MICIVFYQNHEPKTSDTPIYAIEETKTDDSESRNTGIFQRASKFVYIEYYYPNIHMHVHHIVERVVGACY